MNRPQTNENFLNPTSLSGDKAKTATTRLLYYFPVPGPHRRRIYPSLVIDRVPSELLVSGELDFRSIYLCNGCFFSTTYFILFSDFDFTYSQIGIDISTASTAMGVARVGGDTAVLSDAAVLAAKRIVVAEDATVLFSLICSFLQ